MLARVDLAHEGRAVDLACLDPARLIEGADVASQRVLPRRPARERLEREVPRDEEEREEETEEDLEPGGRDREAFLRAERGAKRGLRFALNKTLRELFREKLSILKLGLENRLADRIGLLSGGQRQAVSLLMASLQPSRILLLDEHTAALDPKTAAFVLELTAKIVESSQLTAMMVTHSMRQALDYGSRTVMLHQGRVILDVEGEQRKGMDVADLLHMFEKTRGERLDEDRLLLAA